MSVRTHTSVYHLTQSTCFFFFPFLFLVLLDLHSPGSDASSDGAFRIISQSINTKIHFSTVKNFYYYYFYSLYYI
jgi:hypothetical protein